MRSKWLISARCGRWIRIRSSRRWRGPGCAGGGDEQGDDECGFAVSGAGAKIVGEAQRKLSGGLRAGLSRGELGGYCAAGFGSAGGRRGNAGTGGGERGGKELIVC